ncbi:MAG: DUF2090 domain-containing protein, partial [Betaproteobacteria bacterium AqS2]|nr:DUF2090 domain-containing protein [Betaproteobacteria bacterium AqS2]
AAAARHSYVKGFAVGRTIFAAVALDWFGNKIADDEAVAAMTDNFAQLCAIWDEARAAAG